MFSFSQRHVFNVAGLMAIGLLSACSFNGTFKDATAADAAKLRFISDNENATLDLFDADHCEGTTTGLLNNLFAANTQRRADMRFPAPEGAKAFVEVRLEPGRDYFARVNTGGTGSVCTVAFNLIAQRGVEYEATFSRSARSCQVRLARLSQGPGEVLRSPLVLAERGLPGCAGRTPLFPAEVQAPAQSAERSALIEQIIDASLTANMKVGAPIPAHIRDAAIRLGLEERHQRLGFELPAEYWREYASNTEALADELQTVKARALERYKARYRNYLAGLETDAMQRLVPGSPTADRTQAASTNSAMYAFFQRTDEQLLKQAASTHQGRMADLDRRFEVCARSVECWRD